MNEILTNKVETLKTQVIGTEAAGIVDELLTHIAQLEAQIGAQPALAIKAAISTLSYSEKEALDHVLLEIEGDGGLVVASRIADAVGITRSVIVNALRKFESAGVIKSRSLGMKGTFIKFIHPGGREALGKALAN